MFINFTILHCIYPSTIQVEKIKIPTSISAGCNRTAFGPLKCFDRQHFYQ